MKSGKLRWTGHVGRWKRREIHTLFLARKSEGSHHLESMCSLYSRHKRWRCGHDKSLSGPLQDKWRANVKAVMQFGLSWKCGEFLKWATTCLSVQTKQHGITVAAKFIETNYIFLDRNQCVVARRFLSVQQCVQSENWWTYIFV